MNEIKKKEETSIYNDYSKISNNHNNSNEYFKEINKM